MIAGAKASAMTGKTIVNSAANSQCVELPSAYPAERDRLGKISLMKSQMTVPWPTTCAAIKAKMQAGTIV